MPASNSPVDNLNCKMPDTENNRAVWLAWRKAGICASDSAAIRGLSPFRSRLDIYNDKVGPINEMDFDSGRMKRGRKLESAVVAEFVEATGAKLRRQPAIPSKDFPFMRSTVDRQILTGHGSLTMPDGSQWVPDRPGIFEAKTTSVHYFAKLRREGPPDSMIIQVHHNMIVWGYDYCVLAILCPESFDFRYWVIRMDDTLAVEIVEMCRDFWTENILPKVPPMPIGGSKPVDVPAYEGDTKDLDADPDYARAVDDFAQAKALRAEGEAFYNEAVTNLKDILDRNDTKAAEGCGFRFIWTHNKPAVSMNGKQILAYLNSLLGVAAEKIMEDDSAGVIEAVTVAIEETQNPEFVKANFYKTKKASRPFKPFELSR